MSRRNNDVTITELCHRHFSQKLPRFEKLSWMVASKVNPKDKNIFKVGNKISNIDSIDIILCFFFILISGHSFMCLTFRIRGIHPKVCYKKGTLKNFAKFSRKHLCRVSFLIKLQGKGHEPYVKETPRRVISCVFCKIFKKTFFVKVCERLFLKTRIFSRVSFCKSYIKVLGLRSSQPPCFFT